MRTFRCLVLGLLVVASVKVNKGESLRLCYRLVVHDGPTPKETPLFLYTAYTAAHWPLHARPEDIEKQKGRYAMGWDELRRQRLARMKKLGVVKPDTPLSPRHPNVPAWEDEKHKQWQQRRMEVYAAAADKKSSKKNKK